MLKILVYSYFFHIIPYYMRYCWKDIFMYKPWLHLKAIKLINRFPSVIPQKLNKNQKLICNQSPWGLVRRNSHFAKVSRIFCIYENRLFCALSYPKDASKINAKHVGFFNQISEMKQKFDFHRKKVYNTCCIVLFIFFDENQIHVSSIELLFTILYIVN